MDFWNLSLFFLFAVIVIKTAKYDSFVIPQGVIDTLQESYCNRPEKCNFEHVLNNSIAAKFGLLTCFALHSICSAVVSEGQTITQWTLGETISGSGVDLNQVKGKVVVLQFWDANDPPSLASLHKLSRFDRLYRANGLVLVGAESQGHTKEQIEPALKEAKVEYTITKGANGPVRAKYIPYMMVFDRGGKMIFEGHPASGDFAEKMRKALELDGSLEATPPKDATPKVTSPKVTTPKETPRVKAPVATESAKKPENLIEQQEWTNAKGQSMSAAVHIANQSTVVFVMPDGKKINFPMGNLSEASRSKILEAIKP